jgi:hypothetical protein
VMAENHAWKPFQSGGCTSFPDDHVDLWVPSISELRKIIVRWLLSEIFQPVSLLEDIHPRRFIADKTDCSLFLCNAVVAARRRSVGIECHEVENWRSSKGNRFSQDYSHIRPCIAGITSSNGDKA